MFFWFVSTVHASVHCDPLPCLHAADAHFSRRLSDTSVRVGECKFHYWCLWAAANVMRFCAAWQHAQPSLYSANTAHCERLVSVDVTRLVKLAGRAAMLCHRVLFLQENIAQLGALGLEVHITEVSVAELRSRSAHQR